MSTTRPLSLIVAGSLRDAVATAEVDWRWKRTGEFEFETPAGERVRYVADRSGLLRGRALGTRLYRGHAWDRRDDRHEIVEMINSGRFRPADPSDKPARPPRDGCRLPMCKCPDPFYKCERRF